MLAAPVHAATAHSSAAAPVPTAASAALAPRTLADLETAMRGEAYANASHTFYAARADREHIPVTATVHRTASTELSLFFMVRPGHVR
ncbi:hypothetical protein [Streptomyces sp. NPDC021224]|uniref:hypothetical protein n=1 Tax=unclassified Streptomyces TaxID=2593676 RepID=UPI00379B3BF7